MDYSFDRALIRSIAAKKEKELDQVIDDNYSNFVAFANKEMSEYYEWAISDEYDEDLAKETFERTSAKIKNNFTEMIARVERLAEEKSRARRYKYFNEDEDITYVSNELAKRGFSFEPYED